MIAVKVRDNFKDVDQALNRLADDVARKVMVRALNKTVDQGKTQMVREITREFNVSRDQVSKRLHVTRCWVKGDSRVFVSLESLGARSGGAGRSMNLINFVESRVSLAEARRRRKAGTLDLLRVKIKRTGAAKQLRGAFISTNKKTGGTAVFVRVGKSRMPIQAMSTIDIPSMFNTKRINTTVRAVMMEKFQGNFAREFRSVQGGWVK